jgi:hypothetical protein
VARLVIATQVSELCSIFFITGTGLKKITAFWALEAAFRQKLFEPTQLGGRKPLQNQKASFFGAAGEVQNAWDFLSALIFLVLFSLRKKERASVDITTFFLRLIGIIIQ